MNKYAGCRKSWAAAATEFQFMAHEAAGYLHSAMTALEKGSQGDGAAMVKGHS